MDTEFALAGVGVAKEEVEVVELSTEDEEDEDVADQVEEDQETTQEGDEAGGGVASHGMRMGTSAINKIEITAVERFA